MSPAPSGGGKRPLDAELNLVPFIDLLCSLISFLLMTAVWSQIAALEVQQQPMTDEPPPELKNDKLALKIYVTEKGFLVVGKDTNIPINCTEEPCIQKAAVDGEPHKSFYDFTTLQTNLKEKHAQFPAESDVYIEINDGIPYNEMVRTMDTCMAEGLTAISLGGTML
jgi:biopolymer transport protein ExbD